MSTTSFAVLYVMISGISAFDDMGILFSETMKGFGIAGDLDYETAYAEGKLNRSIFESELTVTIASMAAFIANETHTAVAVGKVIANGWTTPDGAHTSGAYLNIYSYGVENFTLELHYVLPFTGMDGQPYVLQGVKYVYGNHCTDLIPMMTTLYVHVRTGSEPDQGAIVGTGIILIDDLDLIEFLASFRFVGNGTDADKLNTIVEFGTFLGVDILADCANDSAYDTNFWYIWSSDGAEGFLLDLIERPDRLELRLESYSASLSYPFEVKQFLDLDRFFHVNNTVTIGPMTLDADPSHGTCSGTVQNATVAAKFVLSGRNMRFIPAILEHAIYGALPNIESNYGTLVSATINGLQIQPGPMVYTTYPVRFGLSLLQWIVISATRFAGTDLLLEIVGTKLADLWIGSTYLYYKGKEHKLNDPALFSTRIGAHGLVNGGVREFSATVDVPFELSVRLNCSAPVQQFALLEREGFTEIWTTTLGRCSAQLSDGGSYLANGTVLLEVKDRESNTTDRRDSFSVVA